MSDVKTPAAPSAVPAFTKEQLEYIQQVTVATAMAVNGLNAKAPAPRGPIAHEECVECRQYKIACKGEHIEMVVYPTRYPEFLPFFPGVKINGVLYLSNTPNHKVIVPKSVESTINNLVAEFEQNEKATSMSRNKMHSSGSIGRRGTGAVNATAAWR